MHSTASDGTDTPEEIITKCAKLRLEVCSITDHDTMDGQSSAIAAAGERRQKYITGVEFSVRHEGELHILGYGVDIRDDAFVKEMESLKSARVERVYAIIEKLNAIDIPITFEDVQRNARGETLGRPHVALALMEKGYAAGLQDAFNKYLNESGLCYVQRRKLNAREAMEIIAAAGGTPVLAHPKFIRTNNFSQLIGEMVHDGLKGIEAYYPVHTDKDIKRFVTIANRYDLLVTGGSDYHGKMREGAAIACEKRMGPAFRRSVDMLTEMYAK